MKNIAIILFGGNSKRFKDSSLKQFYQINGRPLFSYTLEPFLKSNLIDFIIVVCGAKYNKEYEKFLLNKKYYFVENGKERYDSVHNALLFLNNNSLVKDEDNILIHDGARPLLEEKQILSLIEALNEYKAATLAIKEEDTIAKIVDGKILEVPNRNEYVRIQTPQAFKFKTIYEAHQNNNHFVSDDAQLVLKLKEDVKIVEGSKKLNKITTIEDIKILEANLK